MVAKSLEQLCNGLQNERLMEESLQYFSSHRFREIEHEKEAKEERQREKTFPRNL